jgi:hypothetical protein
VRWSLAAPTRALGAYALAALSGRRRREARFQNAAPRAALASHEQRLTRAREFGGRGVTARPRGRRPATRGLVAAQRRHPAWEKTARQVRLNSQPGSAGPVRREREPRRRVTSSAGEPLMYVHGSLAGTALPARPPALGPDCAFGAYAARR